jgi:hypothetical protein
LDIKQGIEIQIKAQEFEAKVYQAVKDFILRTAGINDKT